MFHRLFATFFPAAVSFSSQVKGHFYYLSPCLSPPMYKPHCVCTHQITEVSMYKPRAYQRNSTVFERDLRRRRESQKIRKKVKQTHAHNESKPTQDTQEGRVSKRYAAEPRGVECGRGALSRVSERYAAEPRGVECGRGALSIAKNDSEALSTPHPS